MNLFATLRLLYAGGPGSGCTGPNCGRPATGKAKEEQLKDVAKRHDVDIEKYRSLVERIWQKEHFENLSALQGLVRDSKEPWQVQRTTPYGATYVKGLGRGLGFVTLIVQESRMADYENGRPTISVQIVHQMKLSDKTSTQPIERSFVWEPRHSQVSDYLANQWKMTDDSWKHGSVVQTPGHQEEKVA